ASGVLLTDHLAALPELRAGDVLEVELLEGHRRKLLLPVAGTVAEYIGVGAYLQRDVLNRVLGEGNAISGAWLSVDPAQQAAVVRALRDAPRIAAVTDRDATIESLRGTMARGVLTFTLVATLMAASICIGVVYNAARITLAERGRELASLRVLGYTRSEVRTLLLGELFTLAFAALLPAMLLSAGLVMLMV